MEPEWLAAGELWGGVAMEGVIKMGTAKLTHYEIGINRIICYFRMGSNTNQQRPLKVLEAILAMG